MVRAAESRGYPTADLLQDAGLTRQLLDDPDARLDGAVVMRLWEALRQRTADPALQLSAPLTLPFGAYRVIDYLVAASATVGDGVHRFARFFGLVADAVVLSVDELPGGHRLHLTTADGGAVPPVYVDYIFAALVRRIRMRIRPDLRLLRVELRRPEPDDPRPWREAFLAPVRFGGPADALHFDDEEWSAPTMDADEALARLLEEHARILEDRIPHPRSAFRTEVEQAIASSLPDRATVGRIAHALHVSVRTLQRRLEADGTTFRDVVEAVSERLAVSYLRNPDVSIAEVAFLLGFSDPSAFNRAFRRWIGDTPGNWREAHPGMR